MTKEQQPAQRGFSLVEVVLALGVFVVAVVSVLGLLVPSVRSVTDIADATVAAGLAENIEFELRRTGFVDLRDTYLPAQASRLYLVATRSGDRILFTGTSSANPDGATGPVSPANNPLNSTPPAIPGIAERDRYFLAEVWRETSTLPLVDSGFLALRVRLIWPWRIPQGPASGTPDADGDPSTRLDEGGTTPASDLSRRSFLEFNVALPR